jgi:hypothetical protein
MISRSRLQHVLLGLASLLTLVLAFSNGRMFVVVGIAILNILAISLVVLTRRWKTQEAIRSAWSSILLAAGAVGSHKYNSGTVTVLLPWIASIIFAIFAVKGFLGEQTK